MENSQHKSITFQKTRRCEHKRLLDCDYDKMHYEEVLDLFCRCIRANISIMLHNTMYEINTLLHRTHFKPPSSVSNNFFLWSHVDYGRLLLLKYAICSLFYAVQHISDVGYTFITHKNHIQIILNRNRVFIMLYNL